MSLGVVSEVEEVEGGVDFVVCFREEYSVFFFVWGDIELECFVFFCRFSIFGLVSGVSCGRGYGRRVWWLSTRCSFRWRFLWCCWW